MFVTLHGSQRAVLILQHQVHSECAGRKRLDGLYSYMFQAVKQDSYFSCILEKIPHNLEELYRAFYYFL